MLTLLALCTTSVEAQDRKPTSQDLRGTTQERKTLIQDKAITDELADLNGIRGRVNPLWFNWRSLYLQGKDAEAQKYLRNILKDSSKDSMLASTLVSMSQRNLYDTTEAIKTERLPPTRFFKDLLNSVKSELGGDSPRLCEFLRFIRARASNREDKKEQYSLFDAEMRIRQQNKRTDRLAYLRLAAEYGTAAQHFRDKVKAKSLYQTALLETKRALNGAGATAGKGAANATSGKGNEEKSLKKLQQYLELKLSEVSR
ncbi:MAG: hypothetical protein IPK73_18495 [Candidatus Obscuribacter sp.]|nr:hypothetical protein [Candidatus Obscuribacter sp.]